MGALGAVFDELFEVNLKCHGLMQIYLVYYPVSIQTFKSDFRIDMYRNID